MAIGRSRSRSWSADHFSRPDQDLILISDHIPIGDHDRDLDRFFDDLPTHWLCISLAWSSQRRHIYGRGLRYYRIGIESPIFLEKSIVSVSYQYRNSWTGKYRISIDFSRWKVSVSVSVSPFSKMSIKFSITPNYTLFWILKCNKNGYFHYFW